MLPTDVGPSVISSRYNSTWVPRGFAVVHAESLGSGGSEGCPTSGGANETAGAKAVVDWLNGRAVAVDADGEEVVADWTTGQVGMLGTSYNGTLPNAVASTGVEGLEAIVPVSAISSWYDYYRADGAVEAPGGYQGEDVAVLAESDYTRADREICRPVIDSLTEQQDRLTGDYSSFWAERDYLQDADDVHAATLVAHGLRDWNVKTRHAAQWYEALKANGVPHKVYWHQGGHAGMPPADELNRWFTHYLYDVDNGVSGTPRARLHFSLGQRAANVTVGLVDLAPDGTVSRVITEGWRDPQNRVSAAQTMGVRPDVPYRMTVTMQANDYIFAAGHRIAAVVMQTEEAFTIRPPAGNELTVDTTLSSFRLPVVGGEDALAAAIG